MFNNTQPGPPATMMAALHTMAEHSKALPPGTNLDLYFAQLMRENHRAAVSMSALELQQGHDPELLRIAQDIYHAHQQLVWGLDSAIERIQAQPPTYHDHTTQSERLSRLLEAATAGLHPAAHRNIAKVEAGPDSLNHHHTPKQEDGGTGSIDHDYAALLVPHHQNSITLARAELELGRDEPLQRAAYFILRDQQREIEQVQVWLTQHPRQGK
ncbi:DUF305 domain-containing protein [Hymenobacter sp. BT186]|uniref:DUF305 domain-containing protein n=1 Tax=Hymenobacter telluris TaxID=2816474 RepID=A0A939F0C7_9BACT|nr:DUF305 domain-containing protein [Hymenobacter telluris]MBO0360426.1 DUF305 domain-containing protein [Hymenobacter telluris]MBW3376453.1 DUF305 domain-containing protein [Hymenobacter norwichensis]